MRSVNTPFDIIEKLQHSVIQHGPKSDRIYLMKLAPEDYPSIIPALQDLARANHYGKIFAKLPAWAREEFAAAGFVHEASVPGYYNGDVDALFLSVFPDPTRAKVEEEARATVENVLRIAHEKAVSPPELPPLPYVLRRLTPDDAHALTSLYGKVFESYPFPIFEREYIVRTMEHDSIAYSGAFDDSGMLIAASSAEMDKTAKNAEMTDFATLPQARGRNTALHLLRLMENDMQQRGMKVLYTIARAHSAGMNVTFSRAGYTFTGTLINNTNIGGSIENMNVWYRRLGE